MNNNTNGGIRLAMDTKTKRINNGRARVKKNSSFLEKLNTYKEKLKSHNKSI